MAKEIAFYIEGNPVHIWRPKNPEHGDLTTDVAFVMAKVLGGKPLDWAEKMKEAFNG